MKARVLVAAGFVLACASQQKSDVIGAQRALARELVRQKNWEGAFAATDGLVRAVPHDGEALALRGIVYREQRLQTESAADLEEAVKREPKLAFAHSALAVLYDMQGRSDDARKHHERAAELEPRNPGYLNNLGFSLFAQGKARDAIPVLHEALRVAPTDGRIRNNLGFAYAAVGEFARAAEQFGLAGSAVDAKNNLGWAYERRGNAAQAYDLYVDALRLDPTSNAARENLRRVAQQLGRKVPADAAANTRS